MNRDGLFWKLVDGELPLSGAASVLGWKFIGYEEEKGEVQIEFDASVSLTNSMGNIQGGMLSAMLDDCMGPAIYMNLPPNKLAVTIESKTSFVRPAPPGRILGFGRIDHAKGSICFTSGWLTDVAGKVLATATATFRIGNLRWHGMIVPRPIAKGMMMRELSRSAKP